MAMAPSSIAAFAPDEGVAAHFEGLWSRPTPARQRRKRRLPPQQNGQLCGMGVPELLAFAAEPCWPPTLLVRREILEVAKYMFPGREQSNGRKNEMFLNDPLPQAYNICNAHALGVHRAASLASRWLISRVASISHASRHFIKLEASVTLYCPRMPICFGSCSLRSFPHRV